MSQQAASAALETLFQPDEDYQKMALL